MHVKSARPGEKRTTAGKDLVEQVTKRQEHDGDRGVKPGEGGIVEAREVH